MTTADYYAVNYHMLKMSRISLQLGKTLIFQCLLLCAGRTRFCYEYVRQNLRANCTQLQLSQMGNAPDLHPLLMLVITAHALTLTLI